MRRAAAAARSLAGVTGEALAAALPDCRPSPSQRQNKRSGGTLHSPDADERGAYLSPAASRVISRQPRTETNPQRRRRSTPQQNTVLVTFVLSHTLIDFFFV